VLLEEAKEVLDANDGPAVSGDHHDRAGAKDGVDGAALKAELAQTATAEECSGRFE
jgi:hypothetical protein